MWLLQAAVKLKCDHVTVGLGGCRLAGLGPADDGPGPQVQRDLAARFLSCLLARHRPAANFSERPG